MTSALLNNRYRIIRALGKGGFGETFLAEDSHMPSRRLCVIKQLKPVANNPQVYELVKERFQREAAILEQLGEGHEQIPKLYAYFAEAGEFYLVQEWIEGVPLNQKIKEEGVLSESVVKEILLNILPVIDYIHNRGIIHRDLKPANIILRQKDGKPVLIDFGIAKETMCAGLDSLGEVTSSIAVGTIGYMPPEQAAGKPVYGSDIYSLGMTAIYLLIGKRPQDLKTNLKTGETIFNDSDRQISSSLAEVLERAVRSHPQERYPTAREMLLALHPVDRLLPQSQTTQPAPILPPLQAKVYSQSEAETVTLPGTVPKTSTPKVTYSRQEHRNRQILLNKVKNYWIKGVLESSLHGKALIELGLEKRLDAVDRPWGMLWETPSQTRQILPPKSKVIQQFDQLGEGRSLLILGEPGSGKTTTLLELARDLINRAEQDLDHPIPVLFNLSSWSQEKQGLTKGNCVASFANWLVREMNIKYQVSQPIGKAWVKDRQLMLMLDGLDEVSSDRRDLCVQAINEFMQSHGQTEIVVCSRIQDYEALSYRLRCQGAIFIQPLTLAQIHQYLAAAGEDLTAVNTALAADTKLQELARSPLMLNIITLAYRGMSITELPSMNLEERRQHLFDNYIIRMFARRHNDRQYSQAQAMQWLTWLAQRMSEESQTVFLIERMQTKWLKTKLQKQIYLGGLLILFVILGLTIGQLLLPIKRVIFWLILVSVIFVLIFGIDRITPVENLKWSWKNAIKTIVRGIILGLVSGFILKIPYELIFNPERWQVVALHLNNGQLHSLVRGMVFGMNMGLIYGLVRALTSPSIDERITIPNQGIRQSLKNAIVFGLLGFLVLGIAANLLHWSFFFWGSFGLCFGIIAGGGEACVKHFMLRFILYCNGYIPWNYARFLDWATERIFLQKVGGGYIFIHRLLLEHFAQMPLEKGLGDRG
ncbi:protein kinase [Planktothrix sp. FACHB-1355]|uniref:non-specific serine/threonine protein kinase n=1 Tax=Aerosakkonema funiforme FACHB-1375 TaxID=2949571 RepID=A0A926VLU0_9CYAN|nr:MULTISPECIES: protein kinase [Oscillatoriales]MBD2186295.1 protein kinase [Aerosakkonema funiforme FACHB-1375]MBD3561827.1 protein kinase [Planktothrix sp. FACHB-1355]